MNAAIALPETTIRLLNAIIGIRSEGVKIKKVVISDDGRKGGIDYLPYKNKFTAAAIESAGIADLVMLYSFQSTRQRVERHFRPGVYDVSGKDILVIE